ncbi:MAG TPA: hypothetical protein V6C81_09475 [Planktothrix sp.]
MYSRRLSALLALPVMAIVIALIGGVPGQDILSDVLNKGAVKLANTYTTTMFGAVLAELVNKQGIARALIRWVAEFAGDNPFLLGLILTLVTGVLFSTLGGLGAVIMVGTIVLPVLLSLGISNVTAGALYLFGISLGGMFNIAGWQLYSQVLGIVPQQIIAFVLPFATVVSLIIVAFLAVELGVRKNLGYIVACLVVIGASFAALAQRAAPTSPTAGAAAASAADPNSITAAAITLAFLAFYALWRHREDAKTNPGFAIVSPLIPLLLVLAGHWDFIPAFVAGIVFCVFCTWKRDSINVLTRSIIDGIAAVIPAVVLMIGIGMLITAVSNPAVATAIGPLIQAVIPTHALAYIIIFTVMAPLALYRGPLSLWGMGSGLVKIIQNTKLLSSQAIMSMLMSVGQVQGICDPTNTANIWIATYLATDTQVLMRKTLPYAWVGVVLGLTLAVWFGYVQW